ncbi:hypothetical protein G7Y89_g13207 [Cudoniella acicularis]|uniref:Phytocyanin domain-containing protein n=1 Tax=Cudoniella acicularis TaxID=354080 RepID=A0A8H4VYG8_9HELO|nr:hypothetical protein G7Y89_g13207 [Cudoniella acicularis]
MLFTATVTNAQAYAYPLEGTAFGVQEVQSISVVAESITAATATTASTASTATSSGPATYTISAGSNPSFTPSTVNANVGDTILFEFSTGNHSITQSSFNSPCVSSNGFDSGYMGNTASHATFGVASSSPQWFFSKQSTDCTDGMVFALNPNSTDTEAAFFRNAINSPLTSSSPSTSSTTPSTSVKVGVGIGVGALVLILAALAGLFFRNRRQKARRGEIKEIDGGYKSTENKGTIMGSDISSMRTTYKNGNHPLDYEREREPPQVPPKGQELHGISSPTELAAGGEYTAVELHGGDAAGYGFPNDRKGSIAGTTEMQSPTSLRDGSPRTAFTNPDSPGSISAELFSPIESPGGKGPEVARKKSLDSQVKSGFAK